MKKINALLLAVLILFSGMHLTLATHLCGGSLAAVKWSFSGAKASCGMEANQSLTSFTVPLFSSHCCDDEVSAYVVDGLYQDASFQWKSFSGMETPAFLVPVSEPLPFNAISVTSLCAYPPPNPLLVSEVRLDDICVFRI